MTSACREKKKSNKIVHKFPLPPFLLHSNYSIDNPNVRKISKFVMLDYPSALAQIGMVSSSVTVKPFTPAQEAVPLAFCFRVWLPLGQTYSGVKVIGPHWKI